MPVGIANAIWAGSIVLVAFGGWLFFKQQLDAPAIIGMVLIIAGVSVMSLHSKTTYKRSIGKGGNSSENYSSN